MLLSHCCYGENIKLVRNKITPSLITKTKIRTKCCE